MKHFAKAWLLFVAGVMIWAGFSLSFTSDPPPLRTVSDLNEAGRLVLLLTFLTIYAAYIVGRKPTP